MQYIISFLLQLETGNKPEVIISYRKQSALQVIIIVRTLKMKPKRQEGSDLAEPMEKMLFTLTGLTSAERKRCKAKSIKFPRKVR